MRHNMQVQPVAVAQQFYISRNGAAKRYFLRKVNEEVYTQQLLNCSHLSEVDFTSSRFHRPQVSSRAVAANKAKFTMRRAPMGP